MRRHEKNGNMRPKRGKSAEKIHIETGREPFFCRQCGQEMEKSVPIRGLFFERRLCYTLIRAGGKRFPTDTRRTRQTRS